MTAIPERRKRGAGLEPAGPGPRLVRTAAPTAPELPATPPARLRRPLSPLHGLDLRRFVLNLMILAAGLCLYHGITEPIVKLTQMFVFSDTHSLASAVLALYYDGELVLAGIIVVFSMAMPIAKLLYLLALGSLPAEQLRGRQHWLRRLEWLGKWSMHDVLILSLTIVYLRAEGISEAASMPGVRWFAAAVILIMLSYGWLKRLAKEDVGPVASGTTSAGTAPLAFGNVRRLLLGTFTVAAAVALALGITQPAIQLTKLYWWTDRHSILSAIYALYLENELFLAGLIGLFSVVIPSLKLAYLLVVSTLSAQRPAARERLLERLEGFGKWSMMDVLVLALVIFYANASVLADAKALPGVYWFAASVLLTMTAYAIAKQGLSSRRRQPAPPS